MTMIRHAVPALGLMLTTTLAGCGGGNLDLDLRDKFGGNSDTTAAAQGAVQSRPAADSRGVISYPNYQVVVARRGDTAATVAARIGLDAGELARYNGIMTNDPLRGGEVLALPRRVSEPSAQTGATQSGPIQPVQVDVTTLASDAIDSAEPTPVIQRASNTTTGTEPNRHKVQRGETAFTIARLYDVSPRALSEWNGLDQDFTIREGQLLLIPPKTNGTASVATTPSVPTTATTAPGVGSQTPTPPSSVAPLPDEDLPSVAESKTQESATPAASTEPPKPVADIGQSSQQSSGTMLMPVDGSIIREYAPGRNEGIDISASPGAPVKAASGGQVAAVTTNSENILIVVVKHPNDLLSVYTHLDDLKVKKGDAVTKGQVIGGVRSGDPSFLHFEVRKGFDSVDPLGYVN